VPAGDLATLGVVMGAVLLITPVLGAYIARVMEGEWTPLRPVLRPIEVAIYRLSGIDETAEQGWRAYAASVLVMGFVAIAAGYLVLRLQGALPVNPSGAVAQSPDLALNTSVSFETNTNWQNYAGETGVTDLTQMLLLAVRNFTSAATGLAVAIALVRGLVRRSAATIGSYWVDLVRSIVYVLLPISLAFALVLVWQGVPQTLDAPAAATTLQGGSQTIALGPVASQEIIKELGNNGGGFFNANSAHPFENPTPLTNLLEMIAMLAIPFALTFTFGRYAGDRRQGWAVFAAMAVVLLGGAVMAMHLESAGNPLFPAGVDQALGNLEGKEVRFGAGVSALFAAITTGTSTGAVTAMHDSLQPLAGLVPLFNIQLGEITPGGIGAGLYGMLVIGAILTVFIAGLMVGRTPEYLGKKVEAYEMKMAMLVVLVLGASILGFTALAVVSPDGRAGPLAQAGPHGFSEILYAFSSQTGNNGSAFAGLSGNTPFYNLSGALAMLVGRYGMIIPVLALAGSMAAKRRVAASPGTFPTTGPLFVVLLIGVIVIVGALTFFPALALGPIAEQLIQNAGGTFR
jgi:potassium-transporting ATPase potassium-binding subunit